jgi:hypothetical protein
MPFAISRYWFIFNLRTFHLLSKARRKDKLPIMDNSSYKPCSRLTAGYKCMKILFFLLEVRHQYTNNECCSGSMSNGLVHHSLLVPLRAQDLVWNKVIRSKALVVALKARNVVVKWSFRKEILTMVWTQQGSYTSFQSVDNNLSNFILQHTPLVPAPN